MINSELSELLTPTGLILGFQLTLFNWRLEREVEVGDRGDIPWLVPSDYISILGMLAFLIGVILLPILGAVTVRVAKASFGLGALLFVGQTLGLAGHYQLYNRRESRKFVWFPVQEKVVVGGTIVISLIYLFAVLIRT